MNNSRRKFVFYVRPIWRAYWRAEIRKLVAQMDVRKNGVLQSNP